MSGKEIEQDTVVVPNTWGMGEEDSFVLPRRPNMADVFARTDKSERYKLFFSYVYHPNPDVRLATLVEAKKLGIRLGENQAVVDALADSSSAVRKAAAQLIWDSGAALEFALRCLSEEIDRTAWSSTMTREQALTALDLLREAAPPDKAREFEESAAKFMG